MSFALDRFLSGTYSSDVGFTKPPTTRIMVRKGAFLPFLASGTLESSQRSLSISAKSFWAVCHSPSQCSQEPFPTSASHALADPALNEAWTILGSILSSDLNARRTGVSVPSSRPFIATPSAGERKYQALYPLAELKNKSNNGLSTAVQYTTRW